MENKIINPENVIYLDIETQYLITDFPGGWKNKDNYKNIKIAELGILHNDEYKTFEEDNINELTNELFDSKTELVVGFNIFMFDYEILKYYFSEDIMLSLRKNSFDIMLEFNKFTGKAGWVSLNDISRRNFDMTKTEDSAKIPEIWRSGEKEKVKQYLLNDLKMTEKFYLYGKKGHVFKYEHKEYGKSYGEREAYVKW